MPIDYIDPRFTERPMNKVRLLKSELISIGQILEKSPHNLYWTARRLDILKELSRIESNDIEAELANDKQWLNSGPVYFEVEDEYRAEEDRNSLSHLQRYGY